MNSLLGALKSKTVWAGVATAVAGQLLPVVNGWIATNPGTASTVVGTAMIVLRAITNKSLAAK